MRALRRRCDRAFRPTASPRPGVGYVPEGRRVFANLTVEENLLRSGRTAGPVDVRRIYETLPAPRRAQDKQGRPALGRRTGDAVDLACADPEPEAPHARRTVAGLGAADRRGRIQDRRRARREGLSVLLVEQNVRAAVEIADRAYVLDDGRIVYEGDAREFGARRAARPRTRRRQRGKMGHGRIDRGAGDQAPGRGGALRPCVNAAVHAVTPSGPP